MECGGKACRVKMHGKSGAVTPGWHFDDNFVMKKNPSIARIECIFRIILSIRAAFTAALHVHPTAWPSW
jgi:hypothetical protein